LVPKSKLNNNNLPFRTEIKNPKIQPMDYEKLNAAVPMLLMKGEKRTRSLLVIYKDKIIAEKYDTGFEKTVY
jgi:hypothetical protein